MSGYPGEGGPSLEQEEWLDARGVNGSRTTGPTYPDRRDVQMPVYRRSDRNPTAGAGPANGMLCGADSGRGYSCTWPAGHTHPQHIAGGIGGLVLAVWPVAL